MFHLFSFTTSHASVTLQTLTHVPRSGVSISVVSTSVHAHRNGKDARFYFYLITSLLHFTDAQSSVCMFALTESQFGVRAAQP